MRKMNEQAAMVAKDDDRRRVKPVVDLAAVEHEFQAAEYQSNQRKSDPIDLQPAGKALCTLALEHVRLNDQPLHEHQRERCRKAR